MSGQEPQGALASDVAKGVSEVHKSEKWRREYMTLAMRFKERAADCRPYESNFYNKSQYRENSR